MGAELGLNPAAKSVVPARPTPAELLGPTWLLKPNKIYANYNGLLHT